MNELSLFSGAGGGILGSKLLGWKTIGYVEINEYCQKIIAARIKDGLFDNAPIYTDINAFIDSGRCELYRGVTDIVSAGFPCQPFSVAGNRKGVEDERNMWPQTLEVVKKVRPTFCFFENVQGLLSARVDDEARGLVYYFGEILRDLAEAGYNAKWCLLGASDVGAPHHRKRIWIYATYAEGKRWEQNGRESRCKIKRKGVLSYKQKRGTLGGGLEGLSNKRNFSDTKGDPGNGAKSKITRHQKQQESKSRNTDKQIDIAHPKHDGSPPAEKERIDDSAISDDNKRQKSTVKLTRMDPSGISPKESNVTKPRSKRRDGVGEKEIQREQRLPWGENIRSIEELRNRPDIPEPLLRRMGDGMADRTHRLTAVGNGQCPQSMVAAYYLLTQEIEGGAK